MSEDDVRELKKAFGLTDFDRIEDTAKTTSIAGQLGQILSYMQKVDAYQTKLHEALMDLKKNKESGHADREMKITMKALEAKVDSVAKMLENLPRTAPAAAQPKAFTKAVDIKPEPSKEAALTSTDLTALAMSGKMSALEVARLNRQLNHSPA